MYALLTNIDTSRGLRVRCGTTQRTTTDNPEVGSKPQVSFNPGLEANHQRRSSALNRVYIIPLKWCSELSHFQVYKSISYCRLQIHNNYQCREYIINNNVRGGEWFYIFYWGFSYETYYIFICFSYPKG